MCCAFPVLLSAQKSSEDGTVTGVVSDPSGARVARASVQLCPEQNGCNGADTLLTDAYGRFSARVPAGSYNVVVDSAGFVPAEQDGVQVSSARTADLVLKLKIAVAPESVVVDPGSSQETGAGDNQSAMILDAARLAELSDDEATFQRQLQIFAGADPSHPAQVLVDGFTNGRIPPKNSIQQVRINQNPFSAQYAGYGMNRVEISTKPGGESLHGSLEGQGYDGSLNAENPYAGSEPPYYEYRVDGDLSGTLDQHTSFFVSAFLHDMENDAAVQAINPAGFGPLAEAVRAPDRTHDLSGRIDRQMRARNTLTFRYEWNDEKIANNGVGLLVLPSEGYDSSTAVQTLQVSDAQIVSAKVVSESRFEYVRSRVLQNALNNSPTLIVEGSFNGGGSSVGLMHDNQDRFETQELISVDLGKHFLRAGVDGVMLRNANESTANYNGTYYFPTLASYPTSPTQYMVTEGTASAAVLTGWLGAYAEDEFKLRKNLTLNYGLRY